MGCKQLDAVFETNGAALRGTCTWEEEFSVPLTNTELYSFGYCTTMDAIQFSSYIFLEGAKAYSL